MEKANYGIDAPSLVRNFLLLGCAMALVGTLVSHFIVQPIVNGIGIGLIWWGASWIGSSVLMVLYAKVGKFKLREKMLAAVNWRGDEMVLDVGTGRGLLMIGAAKKLRDGRAHGIDIWNAEDLSNNSYENTMKNAEAEGVREKVQVLNEDMRKMSFKDGMFDVILSNLAIHNIYNPEGRETACKEIVRVLKPGGMALISDFRHTKDYARIFRDSGLSVEMIGPLYLQTFPPLTIVKAHRR